jgi:hypothetical protein
MQFRGLMAACAAVAALGVTSAANANAIAYYSGVVKSGYDLTGLFGAANSSLAGLAYQEYFYIDPTAGENVTTTTSEKTFGGSSLGLDSAVTATLIINGHALSVSGDFSDVARTGYNPKTKRSEIYDDAKDQVITGKTITNNEITGGIYSTAAGVIPATYNNYNIKVDNSTVFDLGSSFSFHTTDLSGKDMIDTYGVLSPISAAPEPGTWALMVAGVAMTGAALRLSRRSAAVAV